MRTVTTWHSCSDVKGAPRCCFECHGDGDGGVVERWNVDKTEVYVVCCSVAAFLDGKNLIPVEG